MRSSLILVFGRLGIELMLRNKIEIILTMDAKILKTKFMSEN